jgi:ribonuclease R
MISQPEQPEEPFSKDALLEAVSVSETIAGFIKERPVARGITLDHPISKDLDDAFWIEEDPQGGYQLLLSIADVASFVHPDLTPVLDREAFAQAATVYLADEAVLSMLPKILSEDCLSLLEGQPRPAITLTIPLDAQLNLGEPQIARTRFISHKRFSYNEADEEMENSQTEIASMLRLAFNVAQRLLYGRKLKGALALHDIVSGWATTEEGILRPLGEGERYTSHIIPNELMILANHSLALFLARKDIPALYRNHQAKAIAPERSTLLQMMDTAFAHPERLSPEQVRETAHLVMERATYAPSVAGHFGLNLPVYIHLTSPLRRYADLLNQRILLAVLSRAVLPYTKLEMEEKATYINGEEQKRRAAKKSHFLATYDKELQNILPASEGKEDISMLLRDLDAKKFHSVLRIAAEGHILSSVLEQEILRRLELRSLKANDIFTLVFRFQNTGEEWQRVKVAALRWLAKQPDLAISILLMGEQTLSWGAPRYEESGDPDNAGLFQAIVRVSIAGQNYISSPHMAKQKSLAKQSACAEVLVKIAGIADPFSPADAPAITPSLPSPAEQDASFLVTQSASSGKKADSSERNAIGILNEMKQLLLIQAATYDFQPFGPPHERTFTCLCAITSNDGKQIEGSGSGKTKQAAKEVAALEAMRAYALYTIEQTKERDIE